MRETGSYISELLTEHDCVVVPNLGGFVANYSPAQINGPRHLISPPSKKILFNRKLKNNDGLLAEYISAAEQTTFAEATLFLNRFADDIIRRLENGEQVSISTVGSLSMGTEKNIVFEPDTSRNLLIESFGFEIIQATQVIRTEKKNEDIFINRGGKRTDQKSVLRKIAPYAIAPLLVLFLALPFLTGVVKEDKINFSRINPFYNAPPPVYSPAELYQPFTPPAQYASLFDYEATGRTVKYSFVESEITDSSKAGVIVRLGSAAALSETEESTPVVVTPTPIIREEASKKYHIIGGAFRYTDLAELFVADLRKKGFNAYILEEAGEELNKVSYEGFASRNKAIEKLREIQAENPDAWVYRKD